MLCTNCYLERTTDHFHKRRAAPSACGLRVSVFAIVGLLLASTSAAHAEPARGDAAKASNEVWICHQQGYGGSKPVWHTVSGSYASSESKARDDAEHECAHAGLRACRGGGCWRK